MWRIQYKAIELRLVVVFLALLVTLTVNHCAITKRTCRLPKEPYRSFTIYCNKQKSISMVESGEVSSNCTVVVDCDEKFTMKTNNNNVSCNLGKWSSAIPRCKSTAICPSLKVRDRHTILECSINNEKIKCNDKSLAGTIVKQKCDKYHKLADPAPNKQIECKADGEWSRPLSECVPDCGKIHTYQNSESLSPEEAVGDSPWHVALYRNDTRNLYSTAGKLLICGATIVSEYVVITAAQCLRCNAKGNPENQDHPDLYEIVVGKISRNYTIEDSIYQKSYKIREIRCPSDYFGVHTYYANDIALLILKQRIEFNDVVQPACLDLSNTNLKLSDGVTGKVSGWGFNENDEISEVLVKVELPYVSYASCVQMTVDEDKGVISVDKFCGGKHNEASLSQGDSGGGFIFFHPYNSIYYLKGITSTLVPSLGSTQFTDLSKHADLIQQVLQEAKSSHEFYLNREIFGSCPLKVNETNVKIISECDPVYYDDNFQVTYVPHSCESMMICDKHLYGTTSSVCTNGEWTPYIVKCIIPVPKPPTTSIPIGSTCKVPADSKKERYWATCDNVNGTIASGRNANQGCKLQMSCSGGYSSYNSTNNVAVCSGNNWFQEVPHCRSVCSALNIDNIDISCYEGNTKIRCNKLLVSGTTVKPKCKSHYIIESPVSYGEIECNEGGEWNHLLFKCKPECGVVTKGIQKLIVNGTKEDYGDSPWHVAIYKFKNNSTITLQCGGTIVHQRLVITAAHCFEEKAQLELNVSKYEIAVSKISRNYSKVDNMFQRKYKVKQILLPEKGFHGVDTNYAADIALVILNEKIMLNHAVLPACIDLLDDHFNPPNGSPGKVVGWGYSDAADSILSQNLLAVTIPYINYDSCIDLLPIGGKYVLSVDKFCAGNVTGPGVRGGDSGGGLLFRNSQSFYYLRGVVSAKLIDAGSSIGLFTDIAYYSSWISTVINNIEREELNKETTLQEKM